VIARAILPATATASARGPGAPPATALLRALHAKFGTRPGEEEGWLEKPDVASKPLVRARLEAAFRPAHPIAWLKDPHAWLSNLDIQAVMRQYELLLRPTHGFRFLGVVPRDFEAPLDPLNPHEQCVADAICRTRVADLRRQGVRKVGIVFNLDKHTGKGSHWTAMYAGIDPNDGGDRYGAFYYDSLGREPPAEMRRFAERLRSECAKLADAPPSMPFRIGHNEVRKQFANTECGIYSMFFIVACVQSGRSIEDICKRLVRGDKEMHRLRSIMFRPPPGAPAHSHRVSFPDGGFATTGKETGASGGAYPAGGTGLMRRKLAWEPVRVSG
jgi:hypothetical protein